MLEFKVENQYTERIIVESQALVDYQETISLDQLDTLAVEEKVLIRKVEANENFSMEEVFKSIEIYSVKNKPATVDWEDKQQWSHTVKSENEEEYTLVIDASFF